MALILQPVAAQAADAPAASSEAIFVGEIVALLLVGRLLGEILQRIGQPAVVGQLIAGLLLGPSVLGALWPGAQHALFPSNPEQKAMIGAVGQLGVLMLLLLTGMETDVVLIRRIGKAAFSISATGIIVPFACGFALGEMLPEAMLQRPDQRLITALLLGTALSVSSVKIVAMVVREMNFLRRNIGQLIVASAILEDTIGWVLVAIISGLARHGTIDVQTLATSVFGTAMYLVVCATFGRRLVFMLMRWTNDTFLAEFPVITAILVVMGVSALITERLGASTVLGAFVAGVLIGRSPILTKHIDDQLRGLIVALFMPVFFALSGTNVDLRILAHPNTLLLFGAVVLIASLGKFCGALLGGAIGGLTRLESLALACAMNARGSTEVIVATIGLTIGAISRDLFTMIIGMAVITTTAMPPMLRWALGRLPVGDEEQRRLEREAFDAKGFVSKLERLLVAVDDSPKGTFASRLAGLLAGTKGMPVTLLRLAGADPQGTRIRTVVSQAAQESAQALAGSPQLQSSVEVTNVAHAADPETAIAESARRGHHLLVIGLERTVAPQGGFSEEVTRAARSFEGPVAIVSARGDHVRDPLGLPLDILVPVTGADASLRGAEVALALGRATSARLTMLQVANTDVTSALRRGISQPRQDNAAVQRQLAAMAEQYGMPLRTAVRVNIAPEDAILRQARLGNHNLIVMGVSRRPGDLLSYGNIAAAVIESVDRSVVLVASTA